MSKPFVFVDGPSLVLDNPTLWQPYEGIWSLGDDCELGRQWLQLNADPPYRHQFVQWFEPVHDLAAEL